MYTAFVAATTPAIDPATVAAVDLAAKHAEKWPMTVGFFLMLIGFIAFAIWYIRVAYPAQQAATERRVATAIEQGAQTRQFIADALAKRGEEAAKEQKQIVDGIAGGVNDVAKTVGGVASSVDNVAKAIVVVHDRVDAVHDKVDVVHGLVRMLAQKSGLGLVLLLCFSAGAAATQLGRNAWAAWKHPVIDTTVSADCSGIGGCKSPEYCCARDTCCRNATTSACDCPHKRPVEVAPQPRSLAAYIDYGDDPFAALDARRRTL